MDQHFQELSLKSWKEIEEYMQHYYVKGVNQ